jgi:hypothetical protein
LAFSRNKICAIGVDSPMVISLAAIDTPSGEQAGTRVPRTTKLEALVREELLGRVKKIAHTDSKVDSAVEGSILDYGQRSVRQYGRRLHRRRRFRMGKMGLPGNYAIVAGDNGVHSFQVRLRTKGKQTIMVTDTLFSTIKGSNPDKPAGVEGKALPRSSWANSFTCQTSRQGSYNTSLAPAPLISTKCQLPSGASAAILR